MATAGAPINAEPFAATSVQQPRLTLADLPDAIAPIQGLPVLARLPDYGMRPPLRSAKSASLESAVRRWFGQRAALAILVGSGILMAAMAIAPFVGRSPKREPPSPLPTWEPITDQSTRHLPAVPGFETNAAATASGSSALNAAPQAAGDRIPPQVKRQALPESPTSAHRTDPATPPNLNNGLTRLPPIDLPHAPVERPEVRRPITVEQLFAASPDRAVPNAAIVRESAGGISNSAAASDSIANQESTRSSEQSIIQRNAVAPTDPSRGGRNAPLVDRRLSPPPYQLQGPFEEQIATAGDGDAAAPGTAHLEGVIETPSLRANYDPSHSQRY